MRSASTTHPWTRSPSHPRRWRSSWRATSRLPAGSSGDTGAPAASLTSAASRGDDESGSSLPGPARRIHTSGCKCGVLHPPAADLRRLASLGVLAHGLDVGAILGADLVGRPVLDQLTLVDPEHPRADALDCRERVADEEHGAGAL